MAISGWLFSAPLRLCVNSFIVFFTATIVFAQDWPVFTKWDEPMFEGQFFIASDPVVLHEGDLYRMYYTCLDFFDEPRAMICQATSDDGYEWQNIEMDNRVEGLVLRGREDEWDEDLEGAYVIHYGDEYLLYYSGYTHDGGVPAQGYPASLALATSNDGVYFERHANGNPILEPTSGWYDNDAVYSEVVFEYEDGLAMIYVGHCYTNCDFAYNTSLVAATSPNGRVWTKYDDPVLLADPEISWMSEGVAEPALVAEPDGTYTLFFTGLQGEGRVLGMARGELPFGPWEINPDPILTPTLDSYDDAGVLAPHVLVEDGIARMWYLATDHEGYLRIGYAEAEWLHTVQ
jgi:predicted GH43/DUF377 family glycosyl hydrolase